MPLPQNFERAQLVIDGQDPIQCAFNPQEYSITKTNVWTIKPVTGTDTPKPEFGGGMPWTIRVQLLLDASLKGGSAPPFVTFKWGSIESPKMVGSSLSIRFVMFRPNGEPARALVDLELTQSEQAQAGQNPTTRAIAGMKVHTVTDGDSLQSVAYRNYGDATRWRTIAEANGIDDPLSLRRGHELTIPSLET